MKTFSKIMIGTGIGIGTLGLWYFVSKKNQQHAIPQNVVGNNTFNTGPVFTPYSTENNNISNSTEKPKESTTTFVPYASRGLRNNNPGNIRIKKSNPWQGRVPISENTDGVFEQFTSMSYGIRALIKMLMTYNRKYGLNTVQGIISRYAPSNENNTSGYINKVCQRLQVSPTTEIQLKGQTLYKLVKAIVWVENGVDFINPQNYKQALSLI